MKLPRDIFVIFIILSIHVMYLSIPLANAQINRVTVFPSDNASTVSSSPDTNYGGQNTLNVTKYIVLDNIFEEIIWLKFNLSDVPDGAVITSSMLLLYCTSVDEAFNVSVHFCSNNTWNASTITFSSQPNYNPTAMPPLCQTCGPETWALVNTSQQWYSWDVTYAVNKTVDGIHDREDVVTIVLKENLEHESGSRASFYSENGSVAYLPKLTIVWSHVIPEFSPIVLLLGLVAATLAIAVSARVFTIKQKNQSE